MRIVAFGHRQGVGKDTAARFLISELRIKYPGINIQKVGFADKLKDIANQLFSWGGLRPGHYYDSDNTHAHKNVILPILGKTPRDLWIGIGNRLRDVHDTVWLDYVFKYVKADVLVISDCRFPNEANGILGQGGLLYRIDRANQIKLSDGADDTLSDYDKWSSVITNDGTLNDFHSKITSLIQEIMN